MKNERLGTTWEGKGLYPWIIDSLSKVYIKVNPLLCLILNDF